jgi:hypothetical protein
MRCSLSNPLPPLSPYPLSLLKKTLSLSHQKKKFPIGSAVGRDQYAPDDNVTLAAMHKHQTKQAAKAKKA